MVPRAPQCECIATTEMGAYAKPKPSSRAPVSPIRAGPAPRAHGVAKQRPARLRGWSGKSLRGILHLLRPLPTPRLGLFAFKGKHTEENSGRVGVRLPTVVIGPHACQSGRGHPTLWLWSPLGGGMGELPRARGREPVQ